jgi:hypothetical protein
MPALIGDSNHTLAYSHICTFPERAFPALTDCYERERRVATLNFLHSDAAPLAGEYFLFRQRPKRVEFNAQCTYVDESVSEYLTLSCKISTRSSVRALVISGNYVSITLMEKHKKLAAR